MAKVLEGNLIGEGIRLGIVASRFNEFITQRLVGGAFDAAKRLGVSDDALELVWVPGAFEIPMVAKKMAESGRYDAVVCIGTVIRGNTPHFEYVASEVAKGLAQTARETGIPTIFGVITSDNIEQAIERAGTKAGNKGWDAVMAAVEMANLLKAINA